MTWIYSTTYNMKTQNMLQPASSTSLRKHLVQPHMVTTYTKAKTQGI